MMPKFRKKPVVIEALQFDPIQKPWPECITPWSQGPQLRKGGVLSYGFIQTLEGKMEVIAGDWIIKGVRGEFYPCKDEIFSATYEPVDGGKH